MEKKETSPKGTIAYRGAPQSPARPSLSEAEHSSALTRPDARRGATLPAVAKPVAETRIRVRQATAPLLPPPLNAAKTEPGQSGLPPARPLQRPPRDTGEQERLFPTAQWITEDQIRERHMTPAPLSETLRLGPVRPALNDETIRATVSFAHRELAEIRRVKENGDYRRALQLGENLWQALFREQFDWPSYFFLAEVAARMCFLFDPLRDMEKIKPWQERLQHVLAQFRGQRIEDRGLYYHLIAILAINDFFSHVQRYLHALERPGTQPSEKGWEFFLEEWEIYLKKLEDLMAHGAPGFSAGDVAIQLGPRSDYLFSTVRHERLRMAAVSHGDRYRWDPTFLMRDRDSVVSTMPRNPDMQRELAKADRMTAEYIGSFWTPRERQTSKLVSSAEISRVRYAIDSGRYADAKRLSDTLLSRFSLQHRPREEAELLFTRAQGFFVFAESLAERDDPRLLEEAKALKGSNGNRIKYADHILDDGLADALRALQIIERMSGAHPPGLKDFARMCRSLLLRGMTLKMRMNHSLPRELQALAPRLFEICVHDLAAADQTTRSFIYLPRLAESWLQFAQSNIIDFTSLQEQRTLQDMARFGQQSLHDLRREAEESDQSIDIPLDAEGAPIIASNRYLDECFHNRKRPHAPQAYSDRVRQKHRQVAYFMTYYRVT